MILETTRGKELYSELKNDYKEVEKAIKRKRYQIRKPYLNANKILPGIITENFTITTKKNNKWFVSTSMQGNPRLPKAMNHCHVISNAGSEGSRVYIVYRDIKSIGYAVVVCPHVLKRMRERNPEAFGNIGSDDELCGKIFTLDEVGMYYEFNWRRLKSQPIISFPTLNPGTAPLKPKSLGKPVVLKTLAGLFLGYSTEDRREIRLVTYVTSLEQEESFLEPCWVVYNKDKFTKPEIEKAEKELEKYVKDEKNRTVYCLNY